MAKLSPVVWSKGVLLSPQHLQAQERYLEQTLRFQLDAVTFRGWGFTELQLDGAALSNGMLAPQRLSGLFADGLAFEVPGFDEAPPARSLEDCFPDQTQRCMFYLAIPEGKENGVNISAARAGSSSRFFADFQMIRDENGTSQSERPVALARKNLRLIAEGESTVGFSVLPLAAVERTEAGLYRTDPKFVPPMLDLSASATLSGTARGLLELLVARSGQLSGARRQRNDALADFSASDIANFWLLYTLNTELPEFRHLHESTRVHPERLYRAMLRLAGSLITFSQRFDARDLPRYDHQAQGECFGLLDAILRELLETVVPSNFVSLPLRRVRSSVYATAIDKDRYFDNSRFYLAVSANVRPGELISRFPSLSKVASATHIEHYVRQALPGLRMTHLETPPRAIPVKLRYQYFSLERTGEVWEALVRARNLAVYVPDEIAEPEMELCILLSSPE